MKRSFNPSATQMAMICGLGGVIVASGFLLATLFHSRFATSGWLFRMILLLPPFLLGTTFAIMAENRLKRGIKTGRWPPAEIEAVRVNLESSLWRAASIACLVLFCIAIVEGKAYGGLGLALFTIGQTISALQYAIRRPNVSAPRLGLDWTSRPRIHSNHWGER